MEIGTIIGSTSEESPGKGKLIVLFDVSRLTFIRVLLNSLLITFSMLAYRLALMCSIVLIQTQLLTSSSEARQFGLWKRELLENLRYVHG